MGGGVQAYGSTGRARPAGGGAGRAGRRGYGRAGMGGQHREMCMIPQRFSSGGTPPVGGEWGLEQIEDGTRTMRFGLAIPVI